MKLLYAALSAAVVSFAAGSALADMQPIPNPPETHHAMHGHHGYQHHRPHHHHHHHGHH
jgi:hypothetical protein